MFKNLLISLAIAICPLVAKAQPLTPPSWVEPTSEEERFTKVAKIAQDRYVKLETLNIRHSGGGKSNASAVRVGCKLLLSNFHILDADSVTLEPGGEKNESREVTVKGLSTRADLIAIESETTVPELPKMKYAEKVTLGEILINYSNANGADGFLKLYRVAKTEEGGHFLLDRPAIPGESGSGLFNLKGELAGIIDSNVATAADRLYGTAIAVSVIKEFQKAVIDDEGELDACKK